MELLGTSQTFLGFLGSLLVLCILMNEGNFILKIVENVKKDINSQIIDLDNKENLQEYYTRSIQKKQSDLHFDMLLNDTDNLKNHIISKFPMKKDEITSKIEELLVDARTLKMRLDAVFANKKCKSSSQLLEETNPLQEKLQYSNEQCLAPLYMLLLCCTVFIFDEASHFSLILLDFCVSCLVLLTIFSVIFWTGIWGRFKHCFIKELNNSSNEYTNNNSCPITLNLSRSLIILFLGIIVAFLFIWLTDIELIHIDNSIKKVIFYIIGFCLPILYLPICFLKKHKSFGNYSYPFIINHFMGLSVLSITYVIILFGASVIFGESYNCLINYNGNTIILLKMSIFLFIILNGIMMPYLSQIWANNQIKNLVFTKIRHTRETLQNEYSQMERQMDDLSTKINKLNSGDI